MKLELILIQIVIISLLKFHEINGQCWKSAYGRGVGQPISVCRDDEEKNGALCYPKCKDGYYGVGPVCWEKCKSDYTDTGLFCSKGLHTYGKGCCCTIFTKSCCSNCREGYTDFGCTCTSPLRTYTKGSYGRGAGTPLKCRTGIQLLFFIKSNFI